MQLGVIFYVIVRERACIHRKKEKGEVMSYYDLPSRSRSFCETFKLGSNQLPVFLCGFLRKCLFIMAYAWAALVE